MTEDEARQIPAVIEFEHNTRINRIMREENVSREEAEQMWADYVQSVIEDGDDEDRELIEGGDLWMDAHAGHISCTPEGCVLR